MLNSKMSMLIIIPEFQFYFIFSSAMLFFYPKVGLEMRS